MKPAFLSIGLLLLGIGTALAYSPCEDPSLAGNEITNPARSETAPATIICNAELATVSDDSAVVTWVTNKISPSTVDCWAIDGSGCTKSSSPGVYHLVELTDLEPGKVYYYRIENGNDDGLPAPITQQSPGIFRTFDRAKLGRHLFDFASLNDMHVGEGVSGQLTSQAGQPIPPSFSTPDCDQKDPTGSCYWAIMNNGAVEGIRSRAVAFTIVKGDVTSEGGNPNVDSEGRQFDDAATILAPLGSVRPTRGNHDKSLSQFMSKILFRSAVFDPRSLPGYEANDHSNDPDAHFDYAFDFRIDNRRFRFIALDTWDNDHPPAGPAVGAGRITQDQLDWTSAQLDAAERAEVKTFLYMHHPVSEIAIATAMPPLIFGIRQPDAASFLETVGAHRSVVGVFSGHTHRNWITGSALAPGVPFVEVAASKEYPGGYAIYKVFENGYLQSFYKCSTEACLAWSEKTRGEYAGLYPLYTSQTGAQDGSFGYDFRTRKILTAEIE